MQIPKRITCKNKGPVRKAAEELAGDSVAWDKAINDPDHWLNMPVYLEFPLGELCKEGLYTLAIAGRQQPEILGIEESDRFNAQGLEGKGRIVKTLCSALTTTDLMPDWRWQIITGIGIVAQINRPLVQKIIAGLVNLPREEMQKLAGKICLRVETGELQYEPEVKDAVGQELEGGE